MATVALAMTNTSASHLDGRLSNSWFFAGLLPLLLCGCKPPVPDMFPGYAEADFTYISSPLAGQLVRLGVSRGQEVTTGTLLFRLDDELETQNRAEIFQRLQQAQSQLQDLRKGLRPSELAEIEANRKQAQDQLDLSKLEYQRVLRLYQTQVVPEDNLNRAKTQLEVDQARVAALQAQLQTANLGARTDAVKAMEEEVAARTAALAAADWQIAQKNREADRPALVHDTFYTEGEYVPAGRPVLALLVPGQLHIRFFVPEPDLARLEHGMTLALSCDGCPSGLTGTVSFVSREAEFTPPVIYSRELRADLVYLVEAIPEPRNDFQIHAGQPFEVRIPTRDAGNE